MSHNFYFLQKNVKLSTQLNFKYKTIIKKNNNSTNNGQKVFKCKQKLKTLNFFFKREKRKKLQ